jgi:hypothetical protein
MIVFTKRETSAVTEQAKCQSRSVNSRSFAKTPRQHYSIHADFNPAWVIAWFAWNEKKMILFFCRKIVEVLIQTLGNMIQEIDDIDLSYRMRRSPNLDLD